MNKTITFSDEQIKVLISALSLKEVHVKNLYRSDKELVKRGYDHMRNCVEISKNELNICKELQKMLNK